MMIVEAPSAPQGRGFRVWVQGSCRLNGPLWKAAGKGELRVIDELGPFSHTAAEALQITEMLLGERTAPPPLDEIIVDGGPMKSPARVRRSLGDGVDVTLLEICATYQIGLDGVAFSHTALTRQLVAPWRDALLPWFRELQANGAISTQTADAALARAAKRGATIDAPFERLIREMTLAHHSERDIVEAIAAIRRRLGGACVVMGSVELADVGGAIMTDRRERNHMVGAACAAAGAAFFDPSPLVARHGREKALAAGGANLYEWEPTFHPTVAQALVEACFHAFAADAAGEACAFRLTTSPPTSELADRVNAELGDFFSARLARLGSTRSGLLDHYEKRLAAGELIGRRERAALELVRAHLPPFGAYEVLRAGVGELALLLAASGAHVTAYEKLPARRAALTSAAEHLRSQATTSGMLEIGESLPPRGRHGATLLVALEAILGATASVDQELLPRLARYEALLIDPRVFLRRRESDADQAALFAALADLGFDRWRAYSRDAFVYFWRSNAARERNTGSLPAPWRKLTRRPRSGAGGRGGGDRT
jgi:hypothetical protein